MLDPVTRKCSQELLTSGLLDNQEIGCAALLSEHTPTSHLDSEHEVDTITARLVGAASENSTAESLPWC